MTTGIFSKSATQLAILINDTESLVLDNLGGLSKVSSINGGQLAGMRNVIINGACDIAQRGSLVVSTDVNSYGGPDRFHAGNNLAGGQFTQSAATLTFGGEVKNSVRQTVNTTTTAFTGPNHWGGIRQFVEGLNAYHLKDKPFVVSFIFNTNVTGAYSVSVRDAANGYSYVSTFAAVANTPVKVSVAIPVMPSAASIPRTNGLGFQVAVGYINQANNQTASLNSWLTGNFATASGTTIWAATVGNFIELTELQLEEGTVATPFERRSYGAELALCQRYLPCFSVSAANHYFASGMGTSTTTGMILFKFPVTTRVAPTGIAGSSAGNLILSTPTGSYGACGSYTFANADTDTALVSVVPSSAFLVMGSVTFMGGGTASSVYFTGCEL